MNPLSPSVRVWSERLLALEAASRSASGADVHEAVRVCEKLRISLSRFIGVEGFAALLRRGLALARAEFPPLQAVKITADGRLEGLEEIAAADAGQGAEAGIAVTAHLLGLLVTFVGEPLTLRLVRDAWPDASLAE